MKINTEKYNLISQVFINSGNVNYFGEEVSQYEHACQAAMLAKRAGANLEMQRAAFLHDIGHMLPTSHEQGTLDVFGNVDHEKTGASWLKSNGFSELTSQVVENHVDAKRYLCFKNPSYFHTLSDASKATFLFQGGMMSLTEAILFESKPYFLESIQIRQWDDRAKDTEMIVPAMDIFIRQLFLEIDTILFESNLSETANL